MTREFPEGSKITDRLNAKIGIPRSSETEVKFILQVAHPKNSCEALVNGIKRKGKYTLLSLCIEGVIGTEAIRHIQSMKSLTCKYCQSPMLVISLEFTGPQVMLFD